MKKKLIIILFITLFGLIFTGNYICDVIHKDKYYCEELDDGMDCASISPSGMNCYPHINDYKDKKLCRSGWDDKYYN